MSKLNNIEELENISPKGHYETVQEYYKEIPAYDNDGNPIGTERVVIGRDVKWIWDDPEELKKQQDYKELADLEKWFTEVYDAQIKQYNRCQRLGLEYDNKYGTIAELDNQATASAKRISELRNKYFIR